MASSPIEPMTQLWPFRLTVDRYQRMTEAGILTEKDRVFLWKGQLVTKMTKGRPHTVAVLRLTDALKRVVPDGWYVEPEQPLRLNDLSVPEPDLKVVRGRIEDYVNIPSSRDVPLVIEVAGTSLEEDRGEVMESYAAEAIPIYWIANITERRVEVYSIPVRAGNTARYSSCAIYGPGDEVSVVLDGQAVGQLAVSDLFPVNVER